MKSCPKCGTQAVDAARFCRACGAPLAAAAASPPPPPAPQPVSTSTPPKTAAAATPPPPSSAQTSQIEHETPPPPPARGITVTWEKGKRGLMRRTDVVPPEVTVASGSAPVTPTASPSADYSSAGATSFSSAGATASSSPPPSASGATAGTSFTGMVGATEPVNLPPAGTPWKFREQTGAWGDALAATLRKAVASSNASMGGAITRLVRGSFMHRDVYRETAANPQLNVEALYLAAAIIVAGFVGIWLTGFSYLYSSGGIGMFIRLAVIRIVSWAAAVFAIQIAAKSIHQINLPVAAWFRALVYAQAPSLLMIIPAIGMISGIWAAVCSIAAIHDLEGRDTVSAVIVGVIGAVAATVAASVATALLRSFF